MYINSTRTNLAVNKVERLDRDKHNKESTYKKQTNTKQQQTFKEILKNCLRQ